jgi:uncharacterized Zn finger protein
MGFYWRPYVPVARRRAAARKKLEKLQKKGTVIQPVEIDGRTIDQSFWGRAWCDHLESFSDFENRLPRGRTYVRNGSVCHLAIDKCRIDAMVSGSELYKISIEITPLKTSVWNAITKRCGGKIGSLLELLQGKLSDHVMSVVTDQTQGLMPLPGEIKMKCSCPDWATMCKHVAAVLYGIGSRLDSRPELLFTLRNVDARKLISDKIALPDMGKSPASGKIIANERLADVFGIEFDQTPQVTAQAKPKKIIVKKSVVANANLAPETSGAKARRPKKSSMAVSKRKIKDIPASLPTPLTASYLIHLHVGLGLSTAQFAEKLKITPATVYQWYKKRGPIRLKDSTMDALNALINEKSETR